MRSLLATICFLGLISCPLPASAEEYSFTDGNILHGWCNGNHENLKFAINASLCEGYIMGTYQALWASSYAKDGTTETCIPSNVSGNQIRDIVKSYLVNNPSKRHTLGTLVVFDAVNQAFPGCLKL